MRDSLLGVHVYVWGPEGQPHESECVPVMPGTGKTRASGLQWQ